MSFTIEELKEHYKRVRGIVNFIGRQVGRIDKVEQPNPFYGQSHDLGIILGEYYGTPCGVSTPLGWLRIRSSNCAIDESWRPVVKKALGLEPYYGEWRTPKGVSGRVWSPIYTTGPFGGEMGPGWALLRDVNGDLLDKPETLIDGWFMSPVTECRYSYEESVAIWKEHISPIFVGI